MPRGRLGPPLAALLALCSSAATAQETRIEGIYSNEPGCASGFNPGDPKRLYLRDSGVQEYEGGCFFLEKTPDMAQEGAPEAPAFVAIGYCATPAPAVPRLFHVGPLTEREDGRWTLMLAYEAEGRLVATEFHPCPGTE